MKQTICSVGDVIFHDGFPENYDLTPIKNIVEKADGSKYGYLIVESIGYIKQIKNKPRAKHGAFLYGLVLAIKSVKHIPYTEHVHNAKSTVI